MKIKRKIYYGIKLYECWDQEHQATFIVSSNFGRKKSKVRVWVGRGIPMPKIDRDQVAETFRAIRRKGGA